MQTARLRQTTLDRIRAEGAGPLRVHWSDCPNEPRIQYSEPRSGAALSVCAVTVMDETDPRREYYPARFRGLARHYGMRLPTTPPKRPPRRPTLYLRQETFLALPENNGLFTNIWREGDYVFAAPYCRWDADMFRVVIVDGRERIPRAIQKIARAWRHQAPVYERLARIPKARARRLALHYLARANGTARAIWLLGGFPG